VEGGFTWAGSISLMSLLIAVFGAGVVVTKVNAMRQDIRDLKKDLLDKIKEVEEDGIKHISEIRKNLVEQISEVKKDLQRSSEDQGKRIGELEAEQRGTKVRMELTGRHPAAPHEVR